MRKTVFLFLAIVISIGLRAGYSEEGMEHVCPAPTDIVTEETPVLTERPVPVEPAVMESPEVSLKELSGEVVSVDAVASTVVVKELKDAEAQVYEEVTVKVDSVTAIEKNYEMVGLAGLAAGDKVIVRYKTDEFGNNIANLIVCE